MNVNEKNVYFLSNCRLLLMYVSEWIRDRFRHKTFFRLAKKHSLLIERRFVCLNFGAIRTRHRWLAVVGLFSFPNWDSRRRRRRHPGELRCRSEGVQVNKISLKKAKEGPHYPDHWDAKPLRCPGIKSGHTQLITKGKQKGWDMYAVVHSLSWNLAVKRPDKKIAEILGKGYLAYQKSWQFWW